MVRIGGSDPPVEEYREIGSGTSRRYIFTPTLEVRKVNSPSPGF